MADDDLQLACGLAHQLDGALGNIAVAGAVEAVAAQMVFLIVLGGDGVTVGLGGHGHVERGVEHGDLRLAGHDGLTGFDALQVGRIMERTQGDAVTDGLLAGLVDDAGFDKTVAAVENAVADGVDLIQRLDNAVFRVGENVQNGGDGLGMGGHGNFPLDLDILVGNLVGQSAVEGDTLAQTLGKDLAGIRVHELILEGRASCVDNQNFHWLHLL